MKKIFSLFLGLLSLLIPGFLFAQTCDYIDPLQFLRYNEAYNFTDSFTNTRNDEIEIVLFDVNPFPDDAPLQVLFDPQETADIYDKNLVVSQQQDFTGTYRVDFCATNDPDNCDSHTECAPYNVTRCGDGTVDDEYYAPGEIWQLELCDSGVNNGQVPSVPYSITPPPNTASFCQSDCSPATVTGGYCGDGEVDLPYEICGEPGLPACNKGTCEDCKCVASPGICSSTFSGQSFYTTNTGYLDANDPLCSVGTPFEVVYNAVTASWSWKCTDSMGGISDGEIPCSATRLYCGNNNIVENGNASQYPPLGASEQCDGTNLGNCPLPQNGTVICSATCQCQNVYEPLTGGCNTTLNEVLYTTNTGVDYPWQVYGTSLCSGDAVVDPATFAYTNGVWTWSCYLPDSDTYFECGEITRLYCGNNNIVENGNASQYPPSGASEQCDGTNLGNCPLPQNGTVICNATCQCQNVYEPLTGGCNTTLNEVLYTTNTGVDYPWQVYGTGLCSGDAVVDPATFAYTNGVWTWSCYLPDSDTYFECGEITRLYCGNNSVESGSSLEFPSNGANEACDNSACGVGEVCNQATCGCDVIPMQPTCSYLSGANVYDFDDAGDKPLTASMVGLCTAPSTVEWLGYNASSHRREWRCKNGNLLSDICYIPEFFCGDGVGFPTSNYLLAPYSDPQPWLLLEECEDNNFSNTDGCITFTGANNDIPRCKKAACGDGIHQPLGWDNVQGTNDDEACDDGNQIDTDACNNSCQIQDLRCTSQSSCEMSTNTNLPACTTANDCYIPSCGNGTIDPGEECNEPQLSCGPSETCDTQNCECLYVPSCGNGTVDPGEFCGEPGLNCLAGETCNTQACECVYVPGCGNGTADSGEECNEPGLSCGTNETCDTASCQCNYMPSCGNGTADSGEECNEPGLSCGANETCDTANCQCYYVPSCGNGTTDPGEECDDGNQIDTDACNNSCQIQDLRCTSTSSCELSINQNLPSCNSINDCVPPVVTYCGDGQIQTPNSSGLNEQCDNGNQNGIPCVPGYGTSCSFCTTGCQLTGLIGPNCGDGILQNPEECDLGTGNGGMSDCSLMCKHNICHPSVSDLVIQKELIQHTGTCANMTGDLVFKLTYSNVGSGIVSGVIVQDILPAGVSYVGFDSNPLLNPPTLSMSGSLLTFTIGSLAPGQQGVITIYAKMMIGSMCPPGLVNTATISLPVGDPTPYNNTSSVGIPCHNSSCNLLTVTPSIGVAPMTSQFSCQGMGASYQIVIKNKFGATIHTIDAQTGSYTFSDIGTYSASCFVDGATSPACSKAISVGGSCELLSSDITNNREIPLTGNLTCKGNGSQFEIQLFHNNSLQKSWKQQGGTGLSVSHYFDKAGDWRAICFVDGVSHPVCSDATSVNFSTQSLSDTLVSYQQQKSPDPVKTHTITITTAIDPSVSHVSLDTMIQSQQQDLVDSYMKQKLSSLDPKLIDTNLSATPLLQQGIDFHTYIHRQQQQFKATQQSQCIDYCELKFSLKTPIITTTGYCGDAIKQTPNASGFNEQCDDGNQLTGDSCLPNCILPIVIGSGYCGDAIKQMPNSSGFNEQCDYGTTGNNGQIALNGSVCLPGCLLPSGGGGGGGGGNNFCGDGIMRNGEECDNGLTGNNGSTLLNGVICDSNCKKLESSGGGSSGGGGGGIVCGNAIRETGEACDLGSRNGDASLCSSTCRLKGFTPNDPKCEYIDPPSIQAGEMLPIWWNYEGGEDVSAGSCHTGTVGKILQSSLQCHFSIKNPKGIVVDSFTRSCEGNDIDTMKWYLDFVNSLPVATRSLLQSSAGVTAWDASKINPHSPFAIFGEYTVSLDKISYDICSYDGQGFSVQTDSYEDRVCQYNFAITTPYAIQKGVGLSSFADDRDILTKFFSLGGKQLLQGISFDLLQTKSSTDLAAILEPLIDRYKQQATQNVVDATNIFRGMRKLPGQEIYVTDRNFVLDSRDPVNGNKATVLLAIGDVSIRIIGSLSSRMMILAPQGTITFENNNCDVNDSVEGVFIAGSFDTNTVVNSITSETRCSGGGLVVNGLLIGGGEAGIKSLRDRRRSTLNDWFSSDSKRDEQIFDGASLRIQSNAKLWDGLPVMVSEVMKELRVTK